MPTGVPIHDLDAQLHAAAERVLLRDGAAALTSRAVTAEAGVAKGILHRHHSSFDAFLATLVLAHLERIDELGGELRDRADTETVVGNLDATLRVAVDPAVVSLVALICARPRLLDRMRVVTPTGVPLLAELTAHVAAYLTAERGLGRLASRSDVDGLAVTVVGAAHLLALAGDAELDRREHTSLGQLIDGALGPHLTSRSRRAAQRSPSPRPAAA